MKSLFILALLSLVACDTPQRTRFVEQSSFDGSSLGDVEDSSDTVDDSETSSNSDTDEEVSSTPGFEDCNLAHQFSAASIGAFGLCQSSLDERKFKTSFEQADLSVGTCFVPMYMQGSNSYALGRAECVKNQASLNYSMTLYKNIDQEVNAVMVLKASSVNSFMQCMSAKADYMSQFQNCAYNQACVNAATQYAQEVCSSFKTYHASHYRQVAF